MKKILYSILVLTASTAAFANCDTQKLDAQQIAECITIEGAGENYDQWKAEYAKIGTGKSINEVQKTNDWTPPAEPTRKAN